MHGRLQDNLSIIGLRSGRMYFRRYCYVKNAQGSSRSALDTTRFLFYDKLKRKLIAFELEPKIMPIRELKLNHMVVIQGLGNEHLLKNKIESIQCT